MFPPVTPGVTPCRYALMPPNHHHFAFTTSETTILLYRIGPVDFACVNPADDPRKT
jgi:hypothetical protein